MARLKDKYQKEWAPALQKKLELSNKMLTPRLDKIVVNMGFGIVEKDVQKKIVENLGLLTGQHPVLCKARKSISNFKLRDGMIIGAKVTLRGDRMYEFADRLINSALPRIRDFRGVPKRGFDKFGNYTMGLKEHSIFPEIVDTGNHAVDVGMDITFVTTAANNTHARELLEIMGMPFAGR
ncbi:MAG: 50S ribosomal protein L5 [Kiritimatiellae bacterium]|nr:50S ribosomal protein L5 [Kiritimatiellia bacterium]